MRQAVAFFVLAVCGCMAIPNVPPNSTVAKIPVSVSSEASDLAAIERLHQEDIAATLSHNPKALASLWTNDAVRMEPGGPAEVGRQAIYLNDSTAHARSPSAEVVRYAPTITDVQVVQNWAFEWGHFEGAYKESPTDSLHLIHGNLLRVLRRQPDGSWRFARVMWNSSD